MSGRATAVAHPNIALVKYWGKQDGERNLPATPSLSITLSDLETRTTVQEADTDVFTLNGAVSDDRKLAGFLEKLRGTFAVPPLHIDSTNNFPTGAGLASSASGFAALIQAINQMCELGLSRAEMSGWAREGSASAARSLYGGFVALTEPRWLAQQVQPETHWPLAVVVAVTDEGRKSVSSTEGMQRSKASSPYFDAWTQSAGHDFDQAKQAVNSQDFTSLASVAEHNMLKMHALMISSVPSLLYWNAASVACLQAVRSMREDHVPVFATMDAGPQVKAVCLPEATLEVERTLAEVPGVARTIACELGNGAHVV